MVKQWNIAYMSGQAHGWFYILFSVTGDSLPFLQFSFVRRCPPKFTPQPWLSLVTRTQWRIVSYQCCCCWTGAFKIIARHISQFHWRFASLCAIRIWKVKWWPIHIARIAYLWLKKSIKWVNGGSFFTMEQPCGPTLPWRMATHSCASEKWKNAYFA